MGIRINNVKYGTSLKSLILRGEHEKPIYILVVSYLKNKGEGGRGGGAWTVSRFKRGVCIKEREI